MEIIDYKRGNDEGGILINGKDQYIAVTASTSKKFKSLRGAQKFLESYGYKEVRGKHSVGQARKSKRSPRLRGRDDIDWWVAIEKNNARRTNSMLDYSGNKEDMLDLVMAQVDDYAYNHNDSDLIKSIDRAKTAEDLFKREGYISKDKEEYSISDIGDKSFEVLHVTAENFEKLSDIYPDIYERFKDDFDEEDIDY